MNEQQGPQHDQSADSVDAPMAERSARGEARTSVDWTVLLSVLALLAGVAWFFYGRAIHAPFIFDDRISVVQNGSIVKLFPLLGEAGRGGPLTPHKDTVTAGRPVVNLSLAINYYFGRLDQSTRTGHKKPSNISSAPPNNSRTTLRFTRISARRY